MYNIRHPVVWRYDYFNISLQRYEFRMLRSNMLLLLSKIFYL